MIIPSKYISFENSIIFKMLKLLEDQHSGASIKDMFAHFEKDFEAIDEFLYSLDVLYALEMIDVDFEKGTINYAQRD